MIKIIAAGLKYAGQYLAVGSVREFPPEIEAQYTATGKAISWDFVLVRDDVVTATRDASGDVVGLSAGGEEIFSYITPMQHAATGDGVADDLSALDSAASAAVLAEQPLLIDRKYAINSTWTPPADISIIQTDAENAGIIYTGADDVGVEITASCYIDGLVVDESYTGSRVTGQNGTLIAIHGALGETPTYLAGVKIGPRGLEARRTLKLGIAVVNVSDFSADLLRARDVYNHAIMLAGVLRPRVQTVECNNIGDLLKNSSRRGAGVLISADPKDFGDWYAYDEVLPTADAQIGSVKIRGTTDSSFYIHDDAQRGISGVHVDSVDIILSGKDGCKIRSGVTDVSIGTVIASKIANNGFVISGANSFLSETNRVTDIAVGSVSATDCGYDAISVITGVTYGTTRYVDANTAGTSINDSCHGIRLETSDRVTIGSFAVNDVASTPAGSGGHGYSAIDCTDVSASGTVANCAGRAVDARTNSGISLDIIERNSGDPDAGGFTNPVPVTNTAVYLLTCTGSVKLHTTQPTKRLSYPILIENGEVDFTVNNARSQYNLDASSIYVKFAGTGTGQYLNRPRQMIRQSVAFDASGLSPAMTPHTIPGSVVPYIHAVDTGANASVLCKPYNVATGAAGGAYQLSLRDGAGAANLTRTMNILIEAIPASAGWC